MSTEGYRVRRRRRGLMAAVGALGLAAGQLLAVGGAAAVEGVTPTEFEDSVLKVFARPGDENHIRVWERAFPDPKGLVVEDFSRRIRAAFPCVNEGEFRVLCAPGLVQAMEVHTFDGNDTISYAADIPSILDAGDGNDGVHGAGATDAINLGAGNDSAQLTDGRDVIRGGPGTDTVKLSNFDDRVSLDGINDDGREGQQANILGDVENLLGSNGNDTLIGNGSANILDGGAGDDLMLGYGGDDFLSGFAGRDTFSGGDGTDTAAFREHRVPLRISIDDVANDGVFRDGVSVEKDNVMTDVEDVIAGNSDDLVIGSFANNKLFGQNGNDKLVGAGGIDFGFGGNGTDSCDTETKDPTCE